MSPCCSSWLYMICRGVDNEPIRSRLLSQSIGCGKNFNGPEKLSSVQQVGPPGVRRHGKRGGEEINNSSVFAILIGLPC